MCGAELLPAVFKCNTYLAFLLPGATTALRSFTRLCSSSALVCARRAVALASCPMYLPLPLLPLPLEVRPVRRV
jgi:hypothetical protein